MLCTFMLFISCTAQPSPPWLWLIQQRRCVYSRRCLSHFMDMCTSSAARRCQLLLSDQTCCVVHLQDCIFLEDKLCSIYKVRPTQCATYPWWPDLMNPVSWQAEAAEVCEGLDHEDAQSLDVQQASEKLMTAAEYFVMKDAAPRRSKT